MNRRKVIKYAMGGAFGLLAGCTGSTPGGQNDGENSNEGTSTPTATLSPTSSPTPSPTPSPTSSPTPSPTSNCEAELSNFNTENILLSFDYKYTVWVINYSDQRVAVTIEFKFYESKDKENLLGSFVRREIVPPSTEQKYSYERGKPGDANMVTAEVTQSRCV